MEVRSHKRQLFLNVEFFIHEVLQYHYDDIKISCHDIDIHIAALALIQRLTDVD